MFSSSEVNGPEDVPQFLSFGLSFCILVFGFNLLQVITSAEVPAGQDINIGCSFVSDIAI